MFLHSAGTHPLFSTVSFYLVSLIWIYSMHKMYFSAVAFTFYFSSIHRIQSGSSQLFKSILSKSLNFRLASNRIRTRAHPDMSDSKPEPVFIGRSRIRIRLNMDGIRNPVHHRIHTTAWLKVQSSRTSLPPTFSHPVRTSFYVPDKSVQTVLEASGLDDGCSCHDWCIVFRPDDV
jgi:hypothetical protein